MGRLRQGFSLVLKAGVTGGCCLVLAQCGQAPGKFDPKYGVSSSPRLVALGEPVPKGGGSYRVGKPYTIGGRTYEPQENAANYTAEGLASWYGEDFHGRATANGEVYDMASISAAQRYCIAGQSLTPAAGFKERLPLKRSSIAAAMSSTVVAT
jgi:rare lipoprotein A